MMNNKGFTLTEVLLAAMIVGVIGIALAALTTAALRESSVGRTRITLRNQASLFLRQLRQDVRESSLMTITNGGKKLSLTKSSKLDPNMSPSAPSSITYDCSSSGNCKRNSEVVLNYVNIPASGDWSKPFSTPSSTETAILDVRIIVGLDGKPPVKEAIKETFVLPQGV